MSKYVPTIKESINPVAGIKGAWSDAASRRHGIRRELGISQAKPDVAAPPPPVIEDTEAAQQDQADMLRRRRGRAASILTQPGTLGAPLTASKTLLGPGG